MDHAEAEQKRIDGSLALRAEPRVIAIPATDASSVKKLRCRVNSYFEDQFNSFSTQNTYYTALIAGKLNWKAANIYADGGIAGTPAEKREGFRRLVADCKRAGERCCGRPMAIGWTKAELLENILAGAYLEIPLDFTDKLCYIEKNAVTKEEPRQCRGQRFTTP